MSKNKKDEFEELIKRWPTASWDWRMRNLENLIDDPIDKFKEWLHGHPLPFGYELNISFAMKNRPTTWDVIRKRGDYPNEDPEDLPGGMENKN